MFGYQTTRFVQNQPLKLYVCYKFKMSYGWYLQISIWLIPHYSKQKTQNCYQHPLKYIKHNNGLKFDGINKCCQI
jgi:hypothetical protein